MGIVNGMKIAVAGAAGNLGKELVDCLLAEGHSVLALDPSPAALAPWRERLAGIQAVDLRRPEQLAGVLEGIETVITTVGIGRPQRLEDYQEVDYQGNLNLLEAARAAGVRRFVYTSVAKVDTDLSVPLLRAKYSFEEQLKASGMSWLILRPSGYFSDIWRTFLLPARKGPLMLIGVSPERRFSPIHPRDVARFVAQNLDLQARTVELGGPQEFSYSEVARLCFELLGKPAALRVVPLPLFRLLLALLRVTTPTRWATLAFLGWASTTDLTCPPVGTSQLRAYLSACLEQERAAAPVSAGAT